MQCYVKLLMAIRNPPRDNGVTKKTFAESVTSNCQSKERTTARGHKNEVETGLTKAIAAGNQDVLI